MNRRGNEYVSDIIAHASKLCNFGKKKTVSRTISIIARRTRTFVYTFVFAYALLMLCTVSAAMLQHPCPDTRSMPITRFTDSQPSGSYDSWATT